MSTVLFDACSCSFDMESKCHNPPHARRGLIENRKQATIQMLTAVVQHTPCGPIYRARYLQREEHQCHEGWPVEGFRRQLFEAVWFGNACTAIVSKVNAFCRVFVLFSRPHL